MTPGRHPGASSEVQLLGPAQIRALKIAVLAMGVLILAGTAGVIARMIYLAQSSTQVPLTATTSIRLPLPPGTVVRSMAVSGDRLAVHFDSPAGPGITVLDTTTGRIVSRIELAPEQPSGSRSP